MTMTPERRAEVMAEVTTHNEGVKASLLTRVTAIRAAVVALIDEAATLIPGDDANIMTIRDNSGGAGQNFIANLDQVLLPRLTPLPPAE